MVGNETSRVQEIIIRSERVLAYFKPGNYYTERDFQYELEVYQEYIRENRDRFSRVEFQILGDYVSILDTLLATFFLDYPISDTRLILLGS